MGKKSEFLTTWFMNALLGPQSGSRTLPMWQLIPPSVLHAILHYMISTIVRAVSAKIMKSRHRALQQQQGKGKF